jgi:WhiB family transcriptional regulator, redox-sensing transcriptional regulator
MRPSSDSWQDRAACAGMDTEIFFSEQLSHYRRAREICAGCPVQMACLAYAMDRETGWQRHGMWGGLSPQERNQLGDRRAV